MEWSSSLLTPVLAQNGSNKASAEVKQALVGLIKVLDERLQKSPFLTGIKVSAADYAVFSLLTPEGTLNGISQIDCVLKWQKNIANLPEVKVMSK